MARSQQNIKHFKAFIASPGDCSAERAAFREVVKESNSWIKDILKIEFEALGFEEYSQTAGPAGWRTQDCINPSVDSCDLFFLVLHKRWGQKPDGAVAFDSYTMEEYARAVSQFNLNRRPLIFYLFKDVPELFSSAPDEQLTKVLKLRREIERSNSGLPARFADSNQFRQIVTGIFKRFASGDFDETMSHSKAAVTVPQSAFDSNVKLPPVAKPQSREDVVDCNVEPSSTGTKDHELRIAKLAQEAFEVGKEELAFQEFSQLARESGSAAVLFQCAKYLLRRGQYDAAETIVLRGLHLARLRKDAESEASLLVAQGQVEQHLYFRGERAEKLFQEAADRAMVLGADPVRAHALRNLAIIRALRGYFPDALALHREAKALFDSAGDGRAAQGENVNIATVLLQLGDVDEAERLLQEAVNWSQAKGDVRNLAIYRTNLAMAWGQAGRTDEVVTLMEDTIKLCRRHNFSAIEARCLGKLSAVRADQGNTSEAIRLERKALEISQSVGELSAVAIAHHALFALYLQAREGSLADAHYAEAERLLSFLGSPVDLLSLRENAALRYNQLGMKREALDLLTEALKEEYRLGRISSLALIHRNLGALVGERGDIPAAIDHFNLAVEYYEQMGNRRVGAQVLADLATALRAQGRFRDSMETFAKAAKWFEDAKCTNEAAGMRKYAEEVKRLHLL